MNDSSRTVNVITINTDASFYESHNVGGYAFYIICDLFKITKSGKFKANPAHATEAETMCIANALATLNIQKELPKCNYLIINTDSKNSINHIQVTPKGPAKVASAIIKKLVEKLGIRKVEFRHVKAHSNISDARSKVNEWCDREAKKWARQALLEAKQKEAKTGKEATHV